MRRNRFGDLDADNKRPWRWGSHILLDNRLADGGEIIGLMRRPHFYPQEDSWYSFLLEAESTPGPYLRREGLGQLKNSIISSGIEPATWQLVV
jgi:hypothetical protein